jgi:hypothetical protein
LANQIFLIRKLYGLLEQPSLPPSIPTLGFKLFLVGRPLLHCTKKYIVLHCTALFKEQHCTALTRWAGLGRGRRAAPPGRPGTPAGATRCSGSGS